MLVAAPDRLFRQQVRLNLMRADLGCKLEEAGSLAGILSVAGTLRIDCVLLGRNLCETDADSTAVMPVELFATLRVRLPRVPLLVLTPDEEGPFWLDAGADDILPERDAGGLLLGRIMPYAIQLARLQKRLDRTHARLDAQQDVDPLTNLLNRRGLGKALEWELDVARKQGHPPPTALLLDCHNLRWFNESFGYATGDQLLHKIAAGLRGLQRTGAVLARLGGGQFLMLLPSTTVADAAEIGRSLATDIRTLQLRRSGSTPVALRVAVAEIPLHGRGLRGLVDSFHLAISLRDAKALEDVVVVGTAGKARLKAMARWKATLRSGNVLRVLRQAAFDLRDRRCAFYELLVRGPEGLESPRELFAMARALDILEEIDLLCLKTCLQAHQDHPQPLCFHINVLPSTLLNTPIAQLTGLLAERGEHRICLDVDCQQVKSNPLALHGVFEGLRQAGILLGLDNVELDNASTEAILILRPRAVKTSPGLIRGVCEDATRSVRLRELASTAESVGAHLVALGVESEEECNVVAELGFQYGQGFLFEAPSSAREEPHWTERFEP